MESCVQWEIAVSGAVADLSNDPGRPHYVMARIQLLIYLIVWLSTHIASAQKMGAFDFVWKEVTEIEDEGTGEILVIKPKIIRKGRSETALITNFTVSKEVDESVGVKVTLSIFGNGGWRPNFFKHSFPSLCGYLDEFVPEQAQIIYSQFGVEKCPIPEGDYHLDISLSNIKFNVPSFTYGKYKGEVEFFRLSPSGEDYVIGGFVGIGEIIPKKKKG